MLTMLGELVVIGALGALLAGAAVKAAEAERVRVRAEAKRKNRGRR
ncbi:hypothetical protein SAMN05444279_12341 [Ruegeria intermedia]|uniref:Uncharacterized protein n=1 Tax=Ruegeria intermedia TaxID=996115 RepID=A0A1M5A416_9RHOB|nr:hypothetical protein SAMN05444279_12341 [Ruegeria intermedia]